MEDNKNSNIKEQDEVKKSKYMPEYKQEKLKNDDSLENSDIREKSKTETQQNNMNEEKIKNMPCENITES